MTMAGKTRGELFLENRGLYIGAQWRWYSVGANFALLLLYFGVSWFFLAFVEHLPPVNVEGNEEGEEEEGEEGTVRAAVNNPRTPWCCSLPTPPPIKVMG